MRDIDQIQKEIEELQKRRWQEEMADDFFYTNGKARAYDRKLYELKQELKQIKE